MAEVWSPLNAILVPIIDWSANYFHNYLFFPEPKVTSSNCFFCPTNCLKPKHSSIRLLKCLILIHFLLIDYNQLQYNQLIVAVLLSGILWYKSLQTSWAECEDALCYFLMSCHMIYGIWISDLSVSCCHLELPMCQQIPNTERWSSENTHGYIHFFQPEDMVDLVDVLIAIKDQDNNLINFRLKRHQPVL